MNTPPRAPPAGAVSTPEEKTQLAERSFGIARASEQIEAPYRFHAQGLEFIGLPGVLSPNLSPSTCIWRGLPVGAGEVFLEMGCGTGVFAILAALQGAVRVDAADINPMAVENTRINAALHGVEERVRVYESDIFRGLPADTQYDVILWNIPWSHTNQTSLSMVERATFDSGFVLLERYLSESPPFLRLGGRLLVGYSSTYGDIDAFDRLASLYRWNVKMLYRVGTPDTFLAELYELTQQPREADRCSAEERACPST